MRRWDCAGGRRSKASQGGNCGKQGRWFASGLWGFEDRGRLASEASTTGGALCSRRKGRRLAVSMATMRGSEASASVAGGLATMRGSRAHVPARGRRRKRSTVRGGMRGDGHELVYPDPAWSRRSCGARAFERLDDDHPAAAARAAARRRNVFGLTAGLGARALGSGLRRREQLPRALDGVRSKGAGEEAVMSDAVEAARQHVQEKAADELVGVERHRFEPVAALDPVVLP